MVYVRGKVRIRHAESEEIHEISADQIEFDAVGSDERGMGPETTYSAVVRHPALGQLLWTLWEYPVGAENHRETDIGPHELLENVDFGLQQEPPDDDEQGEEGADDRKSRIDALVEWFFGRFEDPVHRLPYVSADGGYQWIYGGPYDAREELEESFPDVAQDIIDAAVDEIEADGLTEWAPVSSREDYVDPDDDGLSGEHDLNEVVRDLDDLISGIPEPASDPVFGLGEDGRVHMAVAPDRQLDVDDGDLLDELCNASTELCRCLAGTNAYTDLLQAVENYGGALIEDPISVSRLYGRGVRFENAAQSIRRRIEADELPAFGAETEQNLGSVLKLHAAYIMSQEVGKRLVQGAAAYQRTPDETAALKEAAEQFSAAVGQRPDVFSEAVRTYVAEVAQDVGEGPHPERSNQVAVTSLGNITGVLLKWSAVAGASAIFGAAVAASGTGAAAIAGGASAINGIASFLASNAPLLLMLAAAAGSDLSWLMPIARLLDKLRRGKRT